MADDAQRSAKQHTLNKQLTNRLSSCCSLQYVVVRNEGSNKLNSQFHISVEIHNTTGISCSCGSADKVRWGTELLHVQNKLLAATASWWLTQATCDQAVTDNGTETTGRFYTSEELTSSAGLWCSLWQDRGEGGSWIQSRTQNQSPTWCDWDFRLGTGFAADSQVTFSGWTLIQLLNWKRTRKVRCSKIRRNHIVWYRWICGLTRGGQKQR